MTDYIVPVLLFLAAALALGKRENAYDLLLQGGADGLKLLVTILPALVLLLTAVHMLRASGAVALLSRFFAPVFSFFQIFRRLRQCQNAFGYQIDAVHFADGRQVRA